MIARKTEKLANGVSKNPKLEAQKVSALVKLGGPAERAGLLGR